MKYQPEAFSKLAQDFQFSYTLHLAGNELMPSMLKVRLLLTKKMRGPRIRNVAHENTRILF